MQDFRIGPAVFLVADRITDPVEDWVNVGGTRGDAKVTPKISLAFGQLDQTGATPRADAVVKRGEMVSATFMLANRDLAVLVRMVPNSVLVTSSGKTALAFASGFSAVTPQAIAVVPVVEYTEDGAWWGSPHAVWFQDAVIVVTGDFSSFLPDGEDLFASSGSTEVTVTSLASVANLASAHRSGAIGPLFLYGLRPLGLDLLWEAGADTGLTPLIGGSSTFARASTATYFAASTGRLTSAGVNTPRLESRGILLEPARTQKTQRNYLHGGATTGWTKTGDAASTLTAVLDTAEIFAAGLNLIATDNYVLKLDNSGGSTTARASSAGTTGNTNKHAVSVYARGTGTVKATCKSPSTTLVTLTTHYQRITDVDTPASGSSVAYVEASAGAVVYFLFLQMEEGEYATSTIPNSTAGSVARAADSWTIAGLGAFDVSNGVTADVEFDALFGAANPTATFAPLAIGTTSAPAQLYVYHNTTGGWMIKAWPNGTGSASDQALVGFAPAANAQKDVTFSWNPTVTKRWAVYDEDAVVTPAAAATVSLSSVTGSALYTIGSIGGGGHVSRVAVARGTRLPAEMRQLVRGALAGTGVGDAAFDEGSEGDPGVSVIHVTPEGDGTWEFTPGEGDLTSLSPTLAEPVAADSIRYLLAAGAGGGGKSLVAFVDNGETAGISSGSAAVEDAEVVTVTYDPMDEVGTHTVEGLVIFTPTEGLALVYVLDPQEVTS